MNSTGLVTANSSGTATITVTTQDGNKTATCAITVPSAGTTYYQIVNRWQSTSYLYDGGNGQVKYGTNPSGNSYQWARIDAGGGYYVLKNRATGNLMHVENQNGSVQCSTGDPTWWSAQWSVSATGDGWNYLINRWQGGERIHLENLLGYAQYANAQTGWHSAMWQFVNPVTGRVSTHGEGAVTDESAVNIYPNPAKGNEIHISLSRLKQNEMANVAIQDMYGKMALETKVGSEGRITHDLKPGLYFVKVRASEINAVKKIIIE